MKRASLLLFCILAAFVLVSCGGNAGDFTKANAPEEQDAVQGEDLESAEPVEVRTEEDLARLIDHVEQWTDGSDVTVQVYLLPEWEDKIDLAWYLLQNDEPIIKDWYEPETRHTFSGLEPGEYRVKYYLRYEDIIKSFYLNPVTVGATEAESADM